MDFKSLINKISAMDDPIDLPKAPVLPQAVQLNEDAQLRVLSGRTTYVAEAKKKAEDDKKEEAVKEEMKVGDTKTTSKGGTVTKTEKGITHTKKDDYDGADNSDKAQTKSSKTAKSSAEKTSGREADKAETKKGKDWEKRFGKDSVKRNKSESLDPSAFQEKFAKMVEAKKDEATDKKKKKVSEGSMKDMMYKDAQRMSREKFVEKYPGEGSYYDDLKKMDESAKPDFLDIDKDGDKKEPMKKAAADKGGDKKDGKKGMSAKQEKFFGKKKTVKESVEPKLSFKQMIALVQESGGQQAIDPTDKELFAWAQRVAQTKFQESMKAEVYAGLVYERMGGVFEMYDVLSEDQK